MLSREFESGLALGIPQLDSVFPGFHRGNFAVLVGRSLGAMVLFLLSVRCQLPFREGGLNSRVVYIDGGNTFDLYAVSALARQCGLEPRSVLEKISVSRAFTAYQLTALVFEKLEETLKRYRSKLVVVSDITGLFLDRDVPKNEGRDIFLKMIRFLSDLASRRRIVVVASYFPRLHSGRNLFLEAVLLAKARPVIRFKKSRGGFKFVWEDHPDIKQSNLVFPSNLVTMDMFTGA